jgi:hypothetical protein
MVEELALYGIRNAQDVATCLNGYDQIAYPEGSEWSLTCFYVPQAFDAGYRLVSDADTLWNAFETTDHKANLPGELGIPMEFFARALEIVLKDKHKNGQEHRTRSAAGSRPDLVDDARLQRVQLPRLVRTGRRENVQHPLLLSDQGRSRARSRERV